MKLDKIIMHTEKIHEWVFTVEESPINTNIKTDSVGDKLTYKIMKEAYDKLIREYDDLFFHGIPVRTNPTFPANTALLLGKDGQRIGIINLKDGSCESTE